jgi:hypothetical protein
MKQVVRMENGQKWFRIVSDGGYCYGRCRTFRFVFLTECLYTDGRGKKCTENVSGETSLKTATWRTKKEMGRQKEDGSYGSKL